MNSFCCTEMKCVDCEKLEIPIGFYKMFLANIFEMIFLTTNLLELIEIGDAYLKKTVEQYDQGVYDEIEKLTRSKSDSDLWIKMRCGHVEELLHQFLKIAAKPIQKILQNLC